MHCMRNSKEDERLLVLAGYYFDVNILTLNNIWERREDFSLKFCLKEYNNKEAHYLYTSAWEKTNN